MPTRYKLSSTPEQLAIEHLGLPERLVEYFRQSGIVSIDQLYALMIGTADIVKSMFAEFDVDFDAQLREAKRRLPADVIADLEAMNERKVEHGMGVIRQPTPTGPLRIIRRS